jgi:hypothetical protein
VIEARTVAIVAGIGEADVECGGHGVTGDIPYKLSGYILYTSSMVVALWESGKRAAFSAFP